MEASSDPPPPRRCPQCGYLLAGLPPVGRCPECGWAYDGRTLVLLGQPPGSAQRGPMMRASPATVFYSSLGLAVALGGLLWAVGGLALGAIGFATLGGFAVAAWLGTRWAEGRRERQQFRLTGAGVAVAGRLGHAEPRPWSDAGPVLVDYSPAPPPGWITATLPGGVAAEAKQKRWRWVSWLPLMGFLKPDRGAGVVAALPPGEARRFVAAAVELAESSGGEVRLTPRASLMFGPEGTRRSKGSEGPQRGDEGLEAETKPSL